MSKRISKYDRQKQLNTLYGHRYTILKLFYGKDQGIQSIKVKCNKCGHIIHMGWSALTTKGKTCPVCNIIHHFNKINDTRHYSIIDVIPHPTYSAPLIKVKCLIHNCSWITTMGTFDRLAYPCPKEKSIKSLASYKGLYHYHSLSYYKVYIRIMLKHIKESKLHILRIVKNNRSIASCRFKVKCSRCGYVFTRAFSYFRRSRINYCPRCKKHYMAKRAYIQTKSRFHQKYHTLNIIGRENKNRYIIKCRTCGYTWTCSRSNITRDMFCINCLARFHGYILIKSSSYHCILKNCLGYIFKLTKGGFVKKVKSGHVTSWYLKRIKRDEIKYPSHYIGNSNGTLYFKCSRCGKVFGLQYRAVFIKCNHVICPSCANYYYACIGKSVCQTEKPSLSDMNIKLYLYGYTNFRCVKYYNNGSDGIHDSHQGFYLKCSNCGNVFQASRDFFRGSGYCPHCSFREYKFHTERITAEYLIRHHIKFIHRYVTNIKYRGYLHFDFWLPQYRIEIEYNGVQHYKPIKHFGGIKAFNDEQHRDECKIISCRRLGIHQILIEDKQDLDSDNQIRNLVWSTLDKKLLPVIK